MVAIDFEILASVETSFFNWQAQWSSNASVQMIRLHILLDIEGSRWFRTKGIKRSRPKVGSQYWVGSSEWGLVSAVSQCSEWVSECIEWVVSE